MVQAKNYIRSIMSPVSSLDDFQRVEDCCDTR